MFRNKIYFFLFCFSSQLLAKKVSELAEKPGKENTFFKSQFELFYHYDQITIKEQEKLNEQKIVSTHLNFKLSKDFYNQKLNLKLQLGLIKLPHTQQVIADRPVFMLSYYWIKKPFFRLRQFSFVHTNTSRKTFALHKRLWEDEWIFPSQTSVLTKEGLVYTLGLESTFLYAWSLSHGKFALAWSMDSYSHAYEKKQFVSKEHLLNEDKDADDLLRDSLVDKEDFASRLYLHSAFTLKVIPKIYEEGLLTELSLHYRRQFQPRYDLQLGNYTYEAMSYNYGGLSFSYHLNKQVDLIYKFYAYQVPEQFASTIDKKPFRTIFKVRTKF